MDENIYQIHGFKTRLDYLKDLSDSYSIPLEAVIMLANILGRFEDFDGLVTACQDYTDSY